MARQKWLIGIAVVVFVVILETIPQILSGRSHMGLRTAYRVLETSLVVVALSLYHRWATRRSVGTMRMLGVSLGISAAVGAICGVLFAFVTSVTITNAPRSLASARVAVAFGVVLGL